MKRMRMPKTGAKPEYSSKKPMVPDAKDTSLNEQQFISQPPMPFKDGNSAGSATTPNVARPNPSASSAKYSPQRPKFPSVKGPFVSVPGHTGSKLFSGSQKPMGGTMKTTDPMAGQHGSPVGRSKKSRSFYGE